jgi:hypothetical protein
MGTTSSCLAVLGMKSIGLLWLRTETFLMSLTTLTLRCAQPVNGSAN